MYPFKAQVKSFVPQLWVAEGVAAHRSGRGPPSLISHDPESALHSPACYGQPQPRRATSVGISGQSGIYIIAKAATSQPGRFNMLNGRFEEPVSGRKPSAGSSLTRKPDGTTQPERAALELRQLELAPAVLHSRGSVDADPSKIRSFIRNQFGSLRTLLAGSLRRRRLQLLLRRAMLTSVQADMTSRNFW
jgi:hypothetical protein